jgi:hypothetical protein
MARLAARPVVDDWALWGRALWRAAAPCVAIMVLLGAWSFFDLQGSTQANDLSQQLEQTLLAAVDQDQTADSTW